MAIIDFDFEITYKKGSELPDYPSRNHINALQLEDLSIRTEQEKDKYYRVLKNFLTTGKFPEREVDAKIVQNMASFCFVDNGILWRLFKRPNKPSRVLRMLQTSMRPATIQAAHRDT